MKIKFKRPLVQGMNVGSNVFLQEMQRRHQTRYREKEKQCRARTKINVEHVAKVNVMQ
jgi:hypothetical protein